MAMGVAAHLTTASGLGLLREPPRSAALSRGMIHRQMLK